MKELVLTENSVQTSLSYQLERMEDMFHVLAEMMGELRSAISGIMEVVNASEFPQVGADCIRPEVNAKEEQQADLTHDTAPLMPQQKETPPVDAGGCNPPLPVVQVSEFLQQRYEFRYNQLTGQTEYRERSILPSPFLLVCPRAKSTFYY